MFKSVPTDSISEPFWGSTTYVVAPDFRRLLNSIESYGILQPIICQESTDCIIDGLHRWEIAKLLEFPEVPVVRVDVSDDEAAVLHVVLNRNRGIVVNKFLSELIQELVTDHDIDADDLQERLGLNDEEFHLLLDGSLIRMRKIKEHKYSPAWVPIESPTGENIVVERPTGDSEIL